MSYEKKDKIFHYHGYGLGIGGYLERQGEHLAIGGLTPGALSIAGGRNVVNYGSWSWTPPFEPPPEQGGFSISVGEAATALWTEENAQEWITYGEVTLKEFNLCNRLKVGLIVSKLTSRHVKNGSGERARISFAGSKLINVTIDGVPIDIELDHTLDRFQTHTELKDVVKGVKEPSPDTLLDAAACTAWTHGFCKRNLIDDDPTVVNPPDYVKDLIRRKSDRVTRTSIVGKVKTPENKPDHFKQHGYSIWIDASSDKPEFGRIFFGEMVVADGMKRLNMVRWNLGCDNCSDGTAGTVDLNGDSMP